MIPHEWDGMQPDPKIIEYRKRLSRHWRNCVFGEGMADVIEIVEQARRLGRLKRQKDWTEKWFAKAMGMTVIEWREAQRQAEQRKWLDRYGKSMS